MVAINTGVILGRDMMPRCMMPGERKSPLPGPDDNRLFDGVN